MKKILLLWLVKRFKRENVDSQELEESIFGESHLVTFQLIQVYVFLWHWFLILFLMCLILYQSISWKFLGKFLWWEPKDILSKTLSSLIGTVWEFGFHEASFPISIHQILIFLPSFVGFIYYVLLYESC